MTQDVLQILEAPASPVACAQTRPRVCATPNACPEPSVRPRPPMEVGVTECPWCFGQTEAVPGHGAQFTLCACRHCINPFVWRRTDDMVCTEPVPCLQDFRALAPAGSVMAGVFGTLDVALASLPVLPETSQRVITLLHDPLSSIADLATVLKEDPAIAVKVLRLANSALYGGTHEIKDIATACARLGMKNIANIVFSIAYGNLYRTADPRFMGFMQALWRHCFATAHYADAIASAARQPKATDVFLAGLVHEIGKLVLLDMITTKYQGRIGRLREAENLLLDVLDRFHLFVGLHTVQHWGLPPQLRITTFCHLQPELVPDRRWLPMTHVIALADAAANVAGYGLVEKPEAYLHDHPSALFLGIPERQFADLHADMRDRLQSVLV